MVERDYKPLLGGVKMEEGKIISAAALELKLIGKMNGTAAREEEIKIDNALGEYVSLFPFSRDLRMLYLIA